FGLRHADPLGVVQDLPLQVRLVDHVVVDDAESSYARGSEVERRRRAESPCADEQYLRLEQLRLPPFADLGDEQVTAVAIPLRVSQPERHFDRQPSVLPRAIATAQAAHLLVAHLLQGLPGEKAARPA